MAVIYPKPENPPLTGDEILSRLGDKLDLSVVKDSPRAARYAVSSVDGSGVPVLTGSSSGGSIPSSGVTSFKGRTLNVLPTTGDYTAAQVTNAADKTANETITGTWTFNNTVVGSVTGNAATVTTNANLTGPITSVGNATAVTNNALTNAMLAQMPTVTLKGNKTAGTANAADLTGAEVNTFLPVFTSTLNGVVPASGGGTTNFLRADGTWTTGSVSGVSSVFGRTGTVVATTGDYTAAQVTNAADKTANETITGTWTFNNPIIINTISFGSTPTRTHVPVASIPTTATQNTFGAYITIYISATCDNASTGQLIAKLGATSITGAVLTASGVSPDTLTLTLRVPSGWYYNFSKNANSTFTSMYVVAE